MVATLPDSIKRKLSQTLDQWQSWKCEWALVKKPEPIGLLNPGLGNYSILVEAQTQFVVRLNKLNPAVIGLNRQAEWRALQSASAAGLAPTPRYYNPELGSLVYDYLDEDEGAPCNIAATAGLLRNIHQLPAIHFRLDLHERLLRYEKHIEHRNESPPPDLLKHRTSILSILESISSRACTTVLCHNDLLQANRIVTQGTLRAIDWEYCAMGNRWFDLAVVCVGDALNAAQAEELLVNYLGEEPNAEERHELQQHMAVYRYLELLWFCALDDPQERKRQLTGARFSSLDSSLRH
ncbi:MAG: choline/ethanolamine kinase family protein [Halioglobus sp.]